MKRKEKKKKAITPVSRTWPHSNRLQFGIHLDGAPRPAAVHGAAAFRGLHATKMLLLLVKEGEALLAVECVQEEIAWKREKVDNKEMRDGDKMREINEVSEGER